MNAPVLTCPCCGQPVPAGQFQVSRISRTLGLTGVTARMVDVLAETPGQWVPTWRVIGHMYANDDEGGPLTADNVVRVLCTRVRPQLADAGYTIEAKRQGRRSGSYRRLVKVST